VKTILETVRRGQPLDTVPFIDVHGHFGSWYETVIPDALAGNKLIAEMDRYGCNQVWVSASDPGMVGDLSEQNDAVFDLARDFPNRIIPYCTLSARAPERNLPELERCLQRGPCIGVKMHVYHQPTYTMKAGFLQPIFERLAEKRLVYLNHSYGDLSALSWALEKYPDLVFISGHASPAINDLALAFPNLKDCTCAAHHYKQVEDEVKRLGTSDTLLVGSDFGLFQLGFGLGMIAYADLPEEHKNAILGLNAMKLLRRVDWFDGLT
jgi:predicted TIM-barrel fold metal-dependent hydrolase